MTAPPPPVTVTVIKNASYPIMWLAGIRQLDLTQHCLRTFAEPDRPAVDLGKRVQTLRLSTQNPPLAWYLCALPIPWNWKANAHLAFEHAPGHQWYGEALVPGLEVELTNARPILGWGEHDIPATEPLRQSRIYRTCRNWQFAWWLRQNGDAPDAPPRSQSQPRRQLPESLF